MPQQNVVNMLPHQIRHAPCKSMIGATAVFLSTSNESAGTFVVVNLDSVAPHQSSVEMDARAIASNLRYEAS